MNHMTHNIFCPRCHRIPEQCVCPPQREWVGLTDKERAEIWNKCDPYDDVDDFALAIEAKLKEKNSD